jgi:hypothetical protein
MIIREPMYHSPFSLVRPGKLGVIEVNLAHQGSDLYPSRMESMKVPSTEMFKMVQTGLGMSSGGVQIRVRARHRAARKGEFPEHKTDAMAAESESSSKGAKAIASGSGDSPKSVLDKASVTVLSWPLT